MTVYGCSLCRTRLSFSKEHIPLIGDGNWYACSHCGAVVCSICGEAIGRKCQICGAPMEYDEVLPTRPLPRDDWQALIPSDEGDDWRPLHREDIIACVSPANIRAIHDTTWGAVREEFWRGVLDLEVRRRLGVLDYEIWIPSGVVRLDGEWQMRLEVAASWGIHHYDCRAEVAEREVLEGIPMLGETKWDIDFVPAAALDARPGVRRAALDTIRRIAPVRAPLAELAAPAARSGDREQRAMAIELLASATGDGIEVEPKTWQDLESKIYGCVLDALPAATQKALEALSDSSSPRMHGDFLVRCVHVLGLVEPVLALVADALDGPRSREVQDAVNWIGWLGAAGARAIPKVATHLASKRPPYLFWIHLVGQDGLSEINCLWELGSDVTKLQLAPGLLALHSERSPRDKDWLHRVSTWLRDHMRTPTERMEALSRCLGLPGEILELVFDEPDACEVFVQIFARTPGTGGQIFSRERFFSAVIEWPRAREALRARALEWPASSVAHAYWGHLGAEDGAFQPRLLHLLANRRADPWDRLRAIEALGRLARCDGSTAMTSLLDIFTDRAEDGTHRVAAAKALAPLELPSAARARIAELVRDERAAVRAHALMLGDVSVQVIRDALADSSPFVRWVAGRVAETEHHAR